MVLFKKPHQIQSKSEALALALRLWNGGHYKKAVELYKKYGITDADFSHALVKSIRKK